MYTPAPMNRRHFVSIMVIALALVASACAPYKILLQSSPSALTSAKSIKVVFDYSAVSLGGQTEEAFLAGKSDEELAKFDEVKANIDQKFFDAFALELAGYEITRDANATTDLDLKVQYSWLEQGKYVVVASIPSRLGARMVFVKDGKEVDAIQSRVEVQATMTRPSIHQRLGVAADILAKRAVHYIRAQTGG